LGDAEGHSAPAPLSPAETVKATPLAVGKYESYDDSEENSPPPQLIDTIGALSV
jgi:hypothetical protein